jgi:predicted RNA polymerase sigma factor
LLLDDYQLRLLFACAHPDLSPKAQVVITLKYVVNLRVDAIGKILAMSLDGVDKLLVRARQQIRDENILLQEPRADLLKPRLNSVHKVLYLIFNEGYKSSSGKELVREDLCEEALITTKSLLETPLANKDTAALYSLMLFNSARFASRFSAAGELLDLENQDRSTWSKDLIMLACNYLQQSQTKNLSTYHIEASIAYMHCTATDFKSTHWNTISNLYAQLFRKNQNPFVEMNYAISLYYAGQKASAFAILNRIAEHPFFNRYYLLNATLGKLYLLEGEREKALNFLTLAHQQATFVKEKDFIQGLINSLS